MNTSNEHLNRLEILRRVLLHVGPADSAVGTNIENGRGYVIDVHQSVCPNFYTIREVLPFTDAREIVAQVFNNAEGTIVTFKGFTDLQDILDLIPENISL